MQTVLVVDDDPAVRSQIAVVLQVEGFTVLTADSAEVALDVVHIEDVDMVMVDVSMPGMGGGELSRALRADPRTAHIRQMLISGDPETSANAAVQLGVDVVLTKPFAVSLFLDALQRITQAPRAAGLPALTATAGELAGILQHRLITPVFQPIVDLRNGTVVGVEGLARGPAGPLHTPHALFARAHESGRLHELDTLCRIAVITAARDAAPLIPPLVFLNVEPGAVHLPMNDELEALLAGSLPFRIVVEFTERALASRVPALLRHAEEIRQRGNVVALDDLGVDPSSVALLPLAQPEIIKLDLSLLAPGLSGAGAEAAIAAATYAQRTGAIILAEGIETEEQSAIAIALGAQWGQGFLFGRPAPINELAGLPLRRDTPPLPRRERVDADRGTTPFGIVTSRGVPIWQGSAQNLLDISGRLELQALQVGDLGAVLATIKDIDNIDDRARTMYEGIALSAGVLGILGRGVPPEPFPCAYGVDLHPDEPLAHEWVLCILGPHFAVVLCARARRGAAGGAERVYDYALSHDAEVAERVGRLLTRRLVPRPAVPRTTALPTVTVGG